MYFTKMHGTGNNYIYVDCIKNDYSNTDFSKVAMKVSDENFGVGSDGLILICKSAIADVKMVMYNKDGSEGKMCGNGIRCVARYVYDNILKKEDLVIQTKSGLKKVKILDKENVIVNMGKPYFTPKQIPVIAAEDIVVNKKVMINNTVYYINCVSLGNPHTVIFVDDVENYDVQKNGSIIQKSALFPDSCNVEFVEIIDKENIKMRIYERGSGETLSCGTGAVASVVMGVKNRYLEFGKPIFVKVKGGTLKVAYNGVTTYLEGNAKYICKGEFYL